MPGSAAVGMDKAFIAMPSSGTPATPLFLHLLQTVFEPIEEISHIAVSARNAEQQARIESVLQAGTVSKSTSVHLDEPDYTDRGPASGIITAHHLYLDATLVVLAVDFPQTEAAALQQVMQAHEADATLPPVTLFLHPEDGNPEVGQSHNSANGP